jgi:hypothetical protein
VVSAAQQSLQRIDPGTNAVTARTPLGKAPGFLAAGEGSVWVQEQGDGTLARIDPQTGALLGRVKVGANLKWGDIDTGAGKVWLRTTDDQVFAVIDAGPWRSRRGWASRREAAACASARRASGPPPTTPTRLPGGPGPLLTAVTRSGQALHDRDIGDPAPSHIVCKP